MSVSTKREGEVTDDLVKGIKLNVKKLVCVDLIANMECDVKISHLRKRVEKKRVVVNTNIICMSVARDDECLPVFVCVAGSSEGGNISIHSLFIFKDVAVELSFILSKADLVVVA